MEERYIERNEREERRHIFPLLLVLALLVIGGVSYAIWAILHTAQSTNTVQTGCFSTTFTEGTSGISLTDAFPVTDEDGKLSDPYTFTIKNTCSISANYEVSLESLENTTLDLSNVKISIDNEEPYLLSTADSKDTTIDNAKDSKILTSGKLTAGGEKTYSIRLWVDENAPLESAANKLYEGKIVVNTEATK